VLFCATSSICGVYLLGTFLLHITSAYLLNSSEKKELKIHFKWSVENKIIITLQSGDTVIFETTEITDSQLTQKSTTESLTDFNWERVYPLSGPVYIDDGNNRFTN
jgi:hypothetical protein